MFDVSITVCILMTLFFFSYSFTSDGWLVSLGVFCSCGLIGFFVNVSLILNVLSLSVSQIHTPRVLKNRSTLYLSDSNILKELTCSSLQLL